MLPPQKLILYLQFRFGRFDQDPENPVKTNGHSHSGYLDDTSRGRGTTSTPFSTKCCRITFAMSAAPVVSPCTQIVSTVSGVSFPSGVKTTWSLTIFTALWAISVNTGYYGTWFGPRYESAVRIICPVAETLTGAWNSNLASCLEHKRPGQSHQNKILSATGHCTGNRKGISRSLQPYCRGRHGALHGPILLPQTQQNISMLLSDTAHMTQFPVKTFSCLAVRNPEYQEMRDGHQ